MEYQRSKAYANITIWACNDLEYQRSKAYANITICALWWETDETENCRPLYNMSPKPGSRDNNYMQKQYVDVSLARATPYNNLIVPFMIIILALLLTQESISKFNYD